MLKTVLYISGADGSSASVDRHLMAISGTGCVSSILTFRQDPDADSDEDVLSSFEAFLGRLENEEVEFVVAHSAGAWIWAEKMRRFQSTTNVPDAMCTVESSQGSKPSDRKLSSASIANRVLLLAPDLTQQMIRDLLPYGEMISFIICKQDLVTGLSAVDFNGFDVEVVEDSHGLQGDASADAIVRVVSRWASSN